MALAERQAAAAAALQAAADQAEAFGFAEALALATDVRPHAHCLNLSLGATIIPKPCKFSASGPGTMHLIMEREYSHQMAMPALEMREMSACRLELKQIA